MYQLNNRVRRLTDAEICERDRRDALRCLRKMSRDISSYEGGSDYTWEPILKEISRQIELFDDRTYSSVPLAVEALPRCIFTSVRGRKDYFHREEYFFALNLFDNFIGHLTRQMLLNSLPGGKLVFPRSLPLKTEFDFRMDELSKLMTIQVTSTKIGGDFYPVLSDLLAKYGAICASIVEHNSFIVYFNPTDEENAILMKCAL